jgi:hypothetical protein
MALEGTIRDFGLPDIFQLIGLQRKTGILTLKSEKENVTVTFENGMVVQADSTSKRIEDRLGNVLVKQAKISKEQLEDALLTQKATLQRLGYVLTAGNYISSDDLRDAIQVQTSQLVFRVFRWRDGDYHFAPADSVDYDRENFTPMSADFILMEGIRMVDEWPIIEKKIPSLEMVFRAVVDHASVEVEGREDSGDDVLALSESGRATNKVRLTAEEDKIFRRVDGNRSVQSIIDSTGIGEFEVCRTLFDLLNRNIIAPLGRGEHRPTETGPVAVPASPALGHAVLAFALLAALASVAIRHAAPFGVVGLPPWLATAFSNVREIAGATRLDKLDRSILAFRLAHGSLPQRLDELVAIGLIDRSFLADAEGRPYRYEPGADGYVLSAVDAAGNPVPASVIERAVPREAP